MHHYLRHLLLLLFAGQALLATAQLDSLVFDVKEIAIDSTQKGHLRLQVDGMPFVLDNEFKSPLLKGYTLPGIWLTPTVSYQPLRNLRLQVGAHMLHFWGAKRYPNCSYNELASWNGNGGQGGFHCVPVLRAEMQLSPAFHIVLGTIYGKSQHQLIEPLYNEELNLTSDPEAGVQMMWHTRPFELDTWVNWQKFIFKNDRGQESFCFGLSTRFHPSRRTARTQWYLPLQVLFQHHGGEINTEATNRTVKTWFNAAAGVGLNIPLTTRIPTSLNLEMDGTYYGQQAGNLLPYQKGYGFYSKAEARVWRFNVGVGYWWCHDFISIYGSPLYGCISFSNDGLRLHNARAITGKVEYAHALGKGFSWGVNAKMHNLLPCDAYAPEQGYYREKNGLSFTAGIYLRFNTDFLLKRF